MHERLEVPFRIARDFCEENRETGSRGGGNGWGEKGEEVVSDKFQVFQMRLLNGWFSKRLRFWFWNNGEGKFTYFNCMINHVFLLEKGEGKAEDFSNTIESLPKLLFGGGGVPFLPILTSPNPFSPELPGNEVFPLRFLISFIIRVSGGKSSRRVAWVIQRYCRLPNSSCAIRKNREG